MKILVTGSSGLLGSNVVRELLRRGHEVKIFVRTLQDISALNGLSFERFLGNILDINDLLKAASDCDVIIHAAANTQQWPTDFKNYEEINIHATLLILKVVKQLAIKRMVYVSTANTFGYGTKVKPGTELSEFRFFNYNSGYITSKFIAQQHVLKEIEQSHLPVIIVNPTFMIGPYDSKPSSGKIILMGLDKKIMICPPGGKSFIDVRDAAMAVCNAITMGKIGECYLLANQNMRYWEFYDLLSVIRETPQTKIPLPKFLIHFIGILGTIYEIIFHKPALLNYTNARLLCLKIYYSGNKAVKELNMPQTPIKQSIEDAILWFEKNHYLNN